MIEASRKHGLFDSRYARKPSRLTLPPANARQTREEVADRLDWYAYSTHVASGHRAHDLQVLEAYAPYRNGSDVFDLDSCRTRVYETRLAALVPASAGIV